MSFYIQRIIPRDLRGFKIYVDPGHGGEQNLGTVGYSGTFAPHDGFYEKDFNIWISNILVSIFRQAGARVRVSRTSCDQFVANQDRAIAANNWGADVFISVHHNFFADVEPGGTLIERPDVGGTLSIVPTRRDGSGFLGELCTTYVSTKLQIERRENIVLDTITVVGQTNMPAVLVEVAFLSNPVEEEMMKQNINQRFAAEGIFIAVREFLRG